MLLQVFLFFILIVGPILLAWLKGDALLNYFELRRQLKHQRRRQRSTRALPVRETIMGTLLQVETRRDDIEDRIGEALARFRQVTANGRALTAYKAAAGILDDLEKVVLARESLFDDYLDTACLQSDTIETITQEVVLLREAAELDRNVSAQPTGAALHLLETLQQAEQKRVQIDQRLHRLGRA
ncbi:MAG: hypothetical protein ACI8V2_001874 [Candidatus Latescibacterota bacterium]|jgi:hypothetical protein